MKPTVLILGATGSLGREMARLSTARDWNVRALVREPSKVQLPYTVIRGDVMCAEDVCAAADGVDVIVHAVNPAAYKGWSKLVLPMLDNTIAAAKQVGATVFLPAPVYVYGAGQDGLFAEDAPRLPTTTKGKLRLEMERRLEASGVPSIVVRAGDFIGAPTASSWFAQAVVTPKRPLARIVYPGLSEAGHAWAYLPDLAETAVRLIERRVRLPRYSVFNFGGYQFERGIELAYAVQRAAGDTRLPIRGFPWWMIRIVGIFNETMAGVVEMSYLWRQTVLLDNRKLVAFLGEEPHTPLEQALRTTMRQLECLPPAVVASLPSPESHHS